jgi:hypothetical protein
MVNNGSRLEQRVKRGVENVFYAAADRGRIAQRPLGSLLGRILWVQAKFVHANFRLAPSPAQTRILLGSRKIHNPSDSRSFLTAASSPSKLQANFAWFKQNSFIRLLFERRRIQRFFEQRGSEFCLAEFCGFRQNSFTQNS